MSYLRRRALGDVRSPTSTEVRSPTSTSSEVRSPTSTSTEVRSPTSTSTDAYTAGNITVTGGAGSGAYTNVTVCPGRPPGGAEHQAWRAGRLPPVQRMTPAGYAQLDLSPPSARMRATDYPDVGPATARRRATDAGGLGDVTLSGIAPAVVLAAAGIGVLLLVRAQSRRARR